MSWEQFKALDSLLEYTRSVRWFYLDGYIDHNSVDTVLTCQDSIYESCILRFLMSIVEQASCLFS
ncbi:MAG: hypothetical protein QQW96_14360 [Tychonema bourrellyi B0820]|nr:hypothetical protein [Tychonema bourrellyi]MDQ2098820.1 hypothetical protein [Tychonema bourrellyi B0820]